MCHEQFWLENTAVYQRYYLQRSQKPARVSVSAIMHEAHGAVMFPMNLELHRCLQRLKVIFCFLWEFSSVISYSLYFYCDMYTWKTFEIPKEQAFLLNLAYSNILIYLLRMKTHSDATELWANFCYFHRKGHPLVLQYEVPSGKDSDWSFSK